MKKFAVILSGCGVFDGSEIHEACLSLLAIKKQGFDYDIFAPDFDQHHVINHFTGKEMNEKRNVLVESARIARGQITSLDELDMENYAALIIPGGFGVAKNISSYGIDRDDFEVDIEVERVIKEAYTQGKPIGALCIAPVVIAKILGNVLLTVGEDQQTIQDIEKMGAKHQKTKETEVLIDKAYKVVSTPCYMLDADIVQIAESADNLVIAVKEML